MNLLELPWRAQNYYLNNSLWESNRMLIPEHREALLDYRRQQKEKAAEEHRKYHASCLVEKAPTYSLNATSDRVLLVDMQSFYANVEKARYPELKHKPVVVASDPKRKGGIVLAACPLAKSYGIRNADFLSNADKLCPDLVVVRPHMQDYINTSLQITQLLECFSDKVEPYSIDEQFISIKGSEKIFGPPLKIAQAIQEKITREIGVPSRLGLGPNKVLSKMACDHFAKKNSTGIFCISMNTVSKYLWPLPVEKMFGIGNRMNTHLKSMGITTIGQLAKFPTPLLTRRWGLIGHILSLTANGIDFSPIRKTSLDSQKELGNQMTLPRDYHSLEEIDIVMLELCETVCKRIRGKNMMAHTVTVTCSGSYYFPSGFSRQEKTIYPTNETLTIFKTAKSLFRRHWDKNPIRVIGIRVSTLRDDSTIQLNIFEDRLKKIEIGYTMDRIQDRFGSTAIMRAVSLTQSGQARERSLKIGGHYK